MANSEESAGRRRLSSPIVIIVIFIIIIFLFFLFILFWNSKFLQRSVGSVCRPPPNNIKVTIQSGKPIVTWTAVAGAKSYNIYVFRSDGTFIVKILDCGCAPKVIDIPCGNYFIQISSNGDNCEGNKSNKVSFSVPCCPQAPLDHPRNFMYDGTEEPGSITLSWSAVQGASSYTIYRSRGSAVDTHNFDEKRTTSETKITFVDLLPGTQHTFIIVTNNSCNDPGRPSKCLKVDLCCSIPPPVEITSLTANDHSVTISWDKTKLTTGYCIYIRQGNEVSVTDFDDSQCVDENTTSFTFSGLDCETLYAIGVLATNGCDYGPLRFGIIKTSRKFHPHRRCHGPHCKDEDDEETEQNMEESRNQTKGPTQIKNKVDKIRATKIANGDLPAFRPYK